MGIPFGGSGGIVFGGGSIAFGGTSAATAYLDTIVVYAPGYGKDTDGGVTQADGAGTTLAADVQPTSAQGSNLTHRLMRADVPTGEAHYNIRLPLMPVDAGGAPLVLAADWRIAWTAHKGVAFPAPVYLTSHGAVEPPGGASDVWSISCTRDS